MAFVFIVKHHDPGETHNGQKSSRCRGKICPTVLHHQDQLTPNINQRSTYVRMAITSEIT